MTRYLASRFAGMAVVMLLVATLVFFITRLAPGDPAAVMLGEQATAADIAQLRASYGLDKPLPVQFVYWLKELARGNLGQSIFLQRPVTQALWERAEPTLYLTLFSIVIAALIGIPCGIASAVWRGRAIDQVFSGFAMLGASVPSFWFGLILMQIFAVALGWFPVAGYGDPGVPLADRLHHLVLPAIVLGTVPTAGRMRQMRANLLDVLRLDYVTTARAKGLDENKVVFKHAVRNAINPLITLFGFTIASLLSGSFIVEIVMAWPGLGSLTLEALLKQDLYLVMGSVVIAATMLVLGNLIADVLLVIADPRIKYN